MCRLAIIAIILFTTAAAAQDRRPSHCIAIADAAPGVEYLRKASLETLPSENSIRITYLDHAMFLIQTARGLDVVTDYAGYFDGSDFLPDVVTMNHAHDTHWTMYPDPGIGHVLKGWGETREGAAHHLDLGEMLIRNVTTDIRGRFGGPEERNGNSIFIFEVAGLCIGHLGHLHHEPTETQYASIGRLDVVMAAVDGGITVPSDTMLRIMARLKPSVMIPMHWFGRGTLERFAHAMSDGFDVRWSRESEYVVSPRTLPSRPTLLVLEPLTRPVFDE